ncbi:MAG: Gldg family protein [Planctomycetota bacterium]|jgi:hypothetical protein|nr:Gldg family protein [Planctomycetota bacterium]
MVKFLALARHEAASLFLNPALVLASGFFVLLDSFAFYLSLIPAGASAEFAGLALFMLFTSMILFPLAAAPSFAAERADGTLETLFTAPVGPAAVVLAKYAGAMLFAAFHLAHGLVYAALLSYGGKLDWNSALLALLALLLFASLAVSLGLAVSILTDSPAAAAAGSGAALLLLAAVAELDPHSGGAAALAGRLGFISHVKRWADGELDGAGLVYFLSATALFLFFAWLAVTAREGGQKPAEPAERRRPRLAWILAGLAFFLFALQAAILHIGGQLENGPFPGRELWLAPKIRLLPLPLALLSLAGAGFVLLPSWRTAGGSGRDGRGWTFAAAAAALAIAVNLGWLSTYPFRALAGGGLSFLSRLGGDWRLDVSDDGRNTLSPALRRLFDHLQGRLGVYCLLSGSAESGGVRLAEEMRRLLERCQADNPLIRARWADPEQNPELAAALARELGLAPGGEDGGRLALDYQGRRLIVPAAALAVPPDWRARAAGSEKWLFDGENQLLKAVAVLIDPRVPNVFFSYGRQEPGLAPAARPERSVSRLARALAAANMRVRQHPLAAGQPIPPECDILAVVSPGIPFQPGEAGEIRRYLERGGRLLLLAPVADGKYRAAGDALAELAFSLGGSYRDDLIEDRINNDNGQAIVPLGTTGKMKPAASAEERESGFAFPLARTLGDNPRSGENGWTSERLVRSFPTAEAAETAGGGRRAGPFTLVYRAWRETGGREARAVVIASGRMAADSDIGRGANEALLLGLVKWLAGRDDAPEAAPARWTDRRLRLSNPELRAVLWIGSAALPLIWLALGVLIWRWRRN